MSAIRKAVLISGCLLFTNIISYSQDIGNENVLPVLNNSTLVKNQFIATSVLFDAALYSLNSINGLLKKENYRNKISSFNNPGTSDLGFSLEAEINLAIKPILIKAGNTNEKKFSEIVTSLILNPFKNHMPEKVFGSGTLFNSLLGLVGSLAINEKKVTSKDVDSFMTSISKYFIQYEKLKAANISFDENINKFNLKLLEFHFDTREFMLDIVTIIYANTSRQELRQKSLEEILLNFLDKDILDTLFEKNNFSNKGQRILHYPGDGIKTAKEIVYGIQKLFNEYQKIYSQNYNEIRTVLLQSKELGKNINTKQVDQAIIEFDQLYKDSREADILNIRLNTLSERLKYLVSLEYMK
ncbi:MAG: hypothetical protein WKF35_04600 [Ferruginibacter sp.]